MLADLSFLAATLSYFAAWDIPVLLRPYDEMNGDWFWWGGKTPASYKKLWRITYDHLVRTKGLHNLIFVWSPNAWDPQGDNVPWDYYPGSDNMPITAAGSNALTRSPWVIWSTWGSGLTKTAINSNADVKATYYATDQVYTGGSGTGFGQNFDWGSVHAR
ncbi:glycosyl hydrolase [Streptomyces sp. NPDC088350]|uniref:glycosyl hydrolase n=1 Tax=Streptomyces sp. NPDC088350 TaxID=3365854 RepID=UPI00381841E3